MSSTKATTADNVSSTLMASDSGDDNITIIENDEVKIFECEKHEEDVDIDGDEDTNRLSPIVKEEEVRQNLLIYSYKFIFIFKSPSQQMSSTNFSGNHLDIFFHFMDDDLFTYFRSLEQ